MTHSRERPVGAAGAGAGRYRATRPARRDFLSGAGVAALSFLPWARGAAAQVCYDQYGRPVATAPATVAPAAVAVPAAPYYGAAGAVSATRQVARRTARRTGRREGVREDVWDAID